MSAPTLWGSSFKINTLTAGQQSSPKIAALLDGTFVAVWVDYSKAAPDLSETAIRGQILNADGTKKGDEFFINTTTAGAQDEPCIAVLSDGRFVVAWTDQSQEGGEQGKGIRARVYKADGSAIGDDFRVNTLPASSQLEPSIAALSNGGFVITYTDYFNGDGSIFGIRAQSFDADLRKLGNEIYANGTTTDVQERSAVIGLKEGRYAVFYQDYSNSPDDPNATIRGRILMADGQPAPGTSEFVVPSARGVKTLVSATTLVNGRFVVVWTHETPRTGDGSGTSIKAQMFNADGTMLGGEFVVNTTTASSQKAPMITATPDGGFAVTFIDQSTSDSYKDDLRMAAFDSSGARLGSDTIVATINRGSIFTGVTTLADGRVVVSWDGTTGRDDPNQDIWGQIVDPRSKAVVLNGTAADDQYVGTRGDDVLKGAGGNDRLTGEVGNDVLDGGTGNDTMSGGDGNDTYYVDSASDVVVDDSGVDTVVTSFSRGLESFLENLTASGSGALTLTGNSLNNVIIGNDASNVIEGGGGADTMQGGAGNDIYYVDHPGDRIVEASNGGPDQVYTTASHALDAYVEHLTASGSSSISLTGNTLANVIKGNNGANKINGGAGNDQLWGSRGKDSFVFNTALNSRTNKDKILDWNYRDDTIQLENKIFKKLTKTGTLKKDYFVIGSKAADSNDFIGYNKKTGDLWYDANGNKSGGQYVFANIGKNKALFHTDFVVI